MGYRQQYLYDNFKHLPQELIMKLRWIFLELSRKRFKKQTHFWMFIGLTTLLSIGFVQVLSDNGTQLEVFDQSDRPEAFEQSDIFSQNEGRLLHSHCYKFNDFSRSWGHRTSLDNEE